MGISYLGARMLWDARQRGACFDDVLTLGHQALRLFPAEFSFFRDAYRDAFGTTAAPVDDYRWGEYMDGFLRGYLGAKSITVLDASAYEDADTVHDMNLPVPESMHNQFDVVIDGGSLEHIFNVPVALANLANILKVGGKIFINTPANNLMGHGFYQFSPELMFRVFSESNGFETDNVMLYEAKFPSVELNKKTTVYRVVDPNAVRQRVGLQNKRPVMMMVEATKRADVQMFAQPPMQSDYVALWQATGETAARSSWKQSAKRLVNGLPVGARAPILGYMQKRRFSLANGGLYTRERWRP